MPSFLMPFPSRGTIRSRRSVARILEAAARRFGRQGFQGASMGEVAQAAGVSKGLLHYHFESKEHLLIEAQRAMFRQVHRRFVDRAAEGHTGIDAALEGLDALWDTVRELEDFTPFMVRTMGAACDEGPLRTAAQALDRETQAMLIDGIRQVLGAELPRLVLPPERLATLIRVTLEGLIVELAQSHTPAERAAVDAAYQDVRTLFARFVVDPIPAPPPTGARP